MNAGKHVIFPQQQYCGFSLCRFLLFVLNSLIIWNHHGCPVRAWSWDKNACSSSQEKPPLCSEEQKKHSYGRFQHKQRNLFFRSIEEWPISSMDSVQSIELYTTFSGIYIIYTSLYIIISIYKMYIYNYIIHSWSPISRATSNPTYVFPSAPPQNLEHLSKNHDELRLRVTETLESPLIRFRNSKANPPVGMYKNLGK